MSLSWPRPLAVLALLTWSAAVAWLMLSRKATDLPLAASSYVNNLGHAVVFGVESLLIGGLLAPGPVGRPARRWTQAALLALAYSAALEWGQGQVSGRHSGWEDMVTNAVGAFGAPWALRAGPGQVRRLVLAALAALAAAALATWS